MQGKISPRGTEPGSVEVGIILALKEEFTELFRELGENYQVHHEQMSNYYYYSFEYIGKRSHRLWRCTATFIGDMGPVQAGLATKQFIQDMKPRILALLGIAGALSPDLRLGDVVVADQVDAYLENSKATDEEDATGAYRISMSGHVYRGSADVVGFARNFEFAYPQLYHEWQEQCKKDLYDLFPKEQLNKLKKRRLIRESLHIFEGHLASSSIVVASRAFLEMLRARDRRYLAVDMEAAGLLAAVSEQVDPLRTLILRAVSDYGDERKTALDRVGEGAFRRYATRNVIHLLWQFLDSDFALANNQVSPIRARERQRRENKEPVVTASVKLFYLYVSQDEEFRQEIAMALAPLFKLNGLRVDWHDHQIDLSDSNVGSLDRSFSQTEFAIVLLSPAFFSTGYQKTEQIEKIIAWHHRNRSSMVSIILRPVDLKHSPFATIPLLLANEQPISESASRSQALLEIAQEIYRRIDALRPFSPYI
jgi:nucleoside phosphorylase